MRPGRLNRSAQLARHKRLRSTKTPQRHTPFQLAAQRDTGPDRPTRELVLERDDYTCAWCRRTILNQPYSLQHRRARGRGGSSNPRINAPSNLITLCGSATSPGGCHLKCEQRTAEAGDLGFVVSLNSIHDPADIPVTHALYGRVYLADDGTVSLAGDEAA
jgi:5-methylcytosine-specific restriction enzyme A